MYHLLPLTFSILSSVFINNVCTELKESRRTTGIITKKPSCLLVHHAHSSCPCSLKWIVVVFWLLTVLKKCLYFKILVFQFLVIIFRDRFGCFPYILSYLPPWRYAHSGLYQFMFMLCFYYYSHLYLLCVCVCVWIFFLRSLNSWRTFLVINYNWPVTESAGGSRLSFFSFYLSLMFFSFNFFKMKF